MQNKGIWATLFIATVSQLAFALPSDSEQEINISSDKQLIDEIAGVTTLTGSVEISQGTILIKADKALIHFKGGVVTKIYTSGTPAHFQQQVNLEDGLIVCNANTISYDIDNKNILLEQDAKLTKADGSSLEGNLISYNVTSQKMNAESKEGEKVHLVIPPKTQEGKDGDS